MNTRSAIRRALITSVSFAAAAAAAAMTLSLAPGATAAMERRSDIATHAEAQADANKRFSNSKNKAIKMVRGEPKTVEAHQAMFDSVSTDEWGGADVSISVRLSDGRRLWLYGDTLSAINGFVHSSAIVQSGSFLDVANGGAQVLPDDPGTTPDGSKRIYWIETAKALPNSMVEITAAPIGVTPGELWSFKRRGPKSRVALIHVDSTGDIQFVRWTKRIPRPDIGMDGEDVEQLGPNHYSYAAFVHDIRLKDGTFLRTKNQNWDDAIENHINEDGTLRYTDWRPFFSASVTRNKPYHGR